jgi:CRISPR/Cas system CSM-associated protein Csm2 small subunit
MKASTILIAFVSILLCGCGSNKETAITGIYVAHFKNEYTITDDTLNITEYSSKDNLYKIESRAAYNKIRNGAIQPKQFEHESHIATWKSDSQILWLQNH